MPETEQLPQPQPIPPTVEPPKTKKRMIFIGGILILAILMSIIIFISFRPKQTKNEQSITQKSTQKDIAQSPTPMPFVEMTIPSLRAREYRSTLGELETISNNGSYMSYVTSYNSDGLRVNGLLTIPQGQKPANGWPAIVFVHGYIPPAQYQTLEKYTDYVDYLARNGFVVFKIDLRGHGNSEGEPGGGYFGSDYIVDTLQARAALASSDFVNPEKIGLWGHSMAGNVLLRSMAAQPDIPAIVIWAGAVYTYVDREKYGINDASFSPSQFNSQRLNRRRELFEKYGSPSAQSTFWRQVIPTNYLDDLQGAISIHHAIDDDVVDIGYSRDLIKILDKSSVAHELYEYQSGGHNIIGSSFNSAMQRSVAFYKKYLGE